MSEIPIAPADDFVVLYRGVGPQDVGKADRSERVGKWWSTNPYYSLGYAEGGAGSMFVAVTNPDTIGTAVDVSLDEGYDNYFFNTDDPPGTRQVTLEEIESLRSATRTSKPADLPGGSLIEWPENAVEIGRSVFLPQVMGGVALAEATALTPTQDSIRGSGATQSP